jgi:hypothetical protein
VIGGFNPIENSVARDVLSALDAGVTPYLSPRFYWFSPLRFLVYGKVRARAGPNTLDDPPWKAVRFEQDLPLPRNGRAAVLLLDAQYFPVIGLLRHFYPGAAVELVRGADGAVMYLRIRIPAEQIEATSGLVARFGARPGGEERVVPAVEGASAPPGAGPASWDGAVRVEKTGPYAVHAPPGISVAIDGKPWTGLQYLGSGLHDLHAEAERLPAQPDWRLSWTRPDGVREEIPPRLVFRVGMPRGGFLGLYYPNPRWEGEPLFERLTPILLLNWIEPEPIPTAPSFSARFLATLRVDRAGTYRFRVEADDGATLRVDGREVGEVVINQRSTFPAAVELSAGDHALEVRYFQLGGADALELYWQPPDEPETIIPQERLTPRSESPAPAPAPRPR